MAEMAKEARCHSLVTVPDLNDGLRNPLRSTVLCGFSRSLPVRLLTGNLLSSN